MTFPHQKHAEEQVLASRETTLEEILMIIAKELTP